MNSQIKCLRAILLIFLFFPACSDGPDTGSYSLVGSQIEGTWPAWSPDGKWLAYSRHGDLWLRPSAGGEEKLATILDGAEYQASWNPVGEGGRLVFINLKDDIYRLGIVELNPYKITIIYESHREISRPCFSHDGSRIFFLSHGEPSIKVINDSGREPETLPNENGWGTSLLSLQVSTTEDYLLYAIERPDSISAIESISISGGVPETIISRKGDGLYQYYLRFASESPNGSKIAYYEAIRCHHPGWAKWSDWLKFSILDLNTGAVTIKKQIVSGTTLEGSPLFTATGAILGYSAAWSPDALFMAYAWYEAVRSDSVTIGNTEAICIDEL
jgi:Tol biopolymer transport system component